MTDFVFLVSAALLPMGVSFSEATVTGKASDKIQQAAIQN